MRNYDEELSILEKIIFSESEFKIWSRRELVLKYNKRCFGTKRLVADRLKFNRMLKRLRGFRRFTNTDINTLKRYIFVRVKK